MPNRDLERYAEFTPKYLDAADKVNRAEALKNIKRTIDERNLNRAKKQSKFWGSWMGVTSKLPEAMKNKVLEVIKKMTTRK